MSNEIAWLERLIAKAETEHQQGFIPRMFDGTPFPDISDAAGAARWLRAELDKLENK